MKGKWIIFFRDYPFAVILSLMPAAQFPSLDGVIDDQAVARIVIGIDHQLPGAVEKLMTISG